MRVFRLFRGGILLLALLSVGACTRPPDAVKPFIYHPDVTADVYYPLEPGNAWTYDVTIHNFESGADDHDVLITQVTGVEGEIVTVSSAGTPIQYRVTPRGIFKHPSEMPLIQLPIVPGAEWPIHIQDLHGVGRIERVDARIEVAGHFFEHCLVVVEDFAEAGIRIRYEYAPRVGLLRMEELFLVEGESYPHLQATLRIYKVGASRR